MTIYHLRTLIDGCDRTTFVLLVAEQLAAQAVLATDATIVQPFFYSVYVHPDHRGKGYAKAVLRAAIDHAQARGLDAVALSVHAENEAAMSLYERLGFFRYGDVSDSGFLTYGLRLKNEND